MRIIAWLFIFGNNGICILRKMCINTNQCTIFLTNIWATFLLWYWAMYTGHESHFCGVVKDFDLCFWKNHIFVLCIWNSEEDLNIMNQCVFTVNNNKNNKYYIGRAYLSQAPQEVLVKKTFRHVKKFQIEHKNYWF